MVALNDLNEASILHNLRMRFKKDKCYTDVGTILVSVNPFKLLLDLYTPDVGCFESLRFFSLTHNK